MNYQNSREIDNSAQYESLNNRETEINGYKNFDNVENNSNIYNTNRYTDNIMNNENERIPLGMPLTYIEGNAGDEIIMNDVIDDNVEKKRVETDKKYSSYFIVYVCLLIAIISYYFKYGKYSRILYGMNYSGKTCGSDLKDQKYLYFPLSPKTSKPEILNKYGKCLESCPTSDNVSNKNTKNGTKGFFEDSFFFSDKNKKKIIYDNKGNTTTNVVYSDYTKSNNNNLYVEYVLNSPYYDTSNIMNICYPKDKNLREKIVNIVFTNRYKSFVNLFSIHNGFSFVFIFAFLTILISLIYFFILYHLSTPAFHLFLILFTLSLLFIPIYLIHKHLFLLFNPIKSSLFTSHYVVSILISLLIFMHGLVSLFIVFIYRSTYKYAAKLIDITLNFLSDIPYILYSPFIITFASFLWFIIWIITYIYIMTAGSYDEKRLNLELDVNGNSEIVSLQKFFYYFRSSYLFSIIWLYLYFFVCEMLQSLNQFTISYIGSVWYFSDKVTLNKTLNPINTMKTIIHYHFGSLILSSFINLSIKLLRVLFFWTNSTLSLPFFFNNLIYNLKEKFFFILKPVSKIIDLHTMSAYCEMSLSSYPYIYACDVSSKKIINSTSPAASLHGVIKKKKKRF